MMKSKIDRTLYTISKTFISSTNEKRSNANFFKIFQVLSKFLGKFSLFKIDYDKLKNISLSIS